MSTASDPAASLSTGDSLDDLRREALEWGRKPRALGTWYVTEHMVRAMRAYGWTIIVGALGQPILYLLGLGIGLAALIDAPIQDGNQAVSYLAFVAPALLMTAAISVASEEFTYPVMAGFKWRRYFFGFSASPLSAGQIANGVVVGASARMFLTVALYYLFIWLFSIVFPGAFGTALHPETAWVSIFVGLLGGTAFGTPLMAYAASIEDDRGQFAFEQRFIFMPMFLFSGTFYPLDTLPVWLQWIGWVSPLWHASELGRVVMYGKDAEAIMILIHLTYLVVLTVAGIVIGRRLFARRLGT